MDEKYRMGLYEKAMPDFPTWEEKLCLAGECGFDWMEISVDETDEKLKRLDYTAQELQTIKTAAANAGVPIRTMCLSGHRRFPLGSRDRAVRARSLEIMKKALDFSAETGIRIIQLAGYDVFYETGGADTAGYFEENLGRCVELAAGQGIVLGFETMETPFLDTVAKGMAHVKRCASPYLGMYPDIGNLKNAAVNYGGDPVDDIRTGAGHIFAAHLKETAPGKYRDMFFGSGHTEYVRCIRELWSQGVRMYTAEFWYHGEENYRENILAASRFLREKIEAAAQGEND